MNVDSYVSVVAALCSVVVLKMFIRAANKEKTLFGKEVKSRGSCFCLSYAYC